MSIVSPYNNSEYKARVLLLPNQMNSNLYINLKDNLKKEVEKKCNKYGYVVKVFKITDYSNGIIEPENMMASAVYNILYSCRICIPLVNTNIICEVTKINPALIRADNGPITSIILTRNINEKNFELDNTGTLNYIKNGKKHPLKPKDMIKMTIIAKRFNKKDDVIKVLGYLEAMATPKEKQMYYDDLYYKEDTDDVFIEFENENEKEEFI
jgi:DNA-directed RNA polymerase subunit E'/Rpb7